MIAQNGNEKEIIIDQVEFGSTDTEGAVIKGEVKTIRGEVSDYGEIIIDIKDNVTASLIKSIMPTLQKIVSRAEHNHIETEGLILQANNVVLENLSQNGVEDAEDANVYINFKKNWGVIQSDITIRKIREALTALDTLYGAIVSQEEV